jgi:hypothetical protein
MLGLQKKRIIPIVLVSVGHYCSSKRTLKLYHEAGEWSTAKNLKKVDSKA